MAEDFTYITLLEGKLKACISLLSREKNAGYWTMKVRLTYENEPAGVTSFNLHGYSRAEAEEVARNFGSNQYLMQQVDEFLWGESD